MIPLWDLAVLLLGAKIGGSIFSRLQQPSLIGELLAGIILGSWLKIVTNLDTIQIVAQLGTMFLILLTMMTIDFSKIEKDIEKYVAAQAISASVIFMLLLAFSSMLSIKFDLMLFIVVSIFGSSTAIAARTLMTMNVMTSKEGQAIIGLQIINGIVELILISSVLNIVQYHQLEIEPMVKLVLIMVGTVVVMSRVGGRFITWVFNYAQQFKMEDALLALTLVFAFTAAGFAEKAQMTSFLGIMLVGMLISRAPQAPTISQKIKELGDSFFIPIFFASLGVGISLTVFTENTTMLVTLLLGITFIRLLAYVIPLKFMDYSTMESIKIGIGMISMSEYGLLILSLGLTTYGIIDQTLYSIFVVIFLIVNILSPVAFKLLYGLSPNEYSRSWEKKKNGFPRTK
jgi:Kef-type K+ transport system membrane component KefB